MKTIKFFSLILLAALPFLSFNSAPTKVDFGYYAFIVVDGSWKNKVGYTSRIIYYPGWADCGKRRDIDFFAESKSAFSSHLKAYYNNAFPYGENNNFQLVANLKYNTSAYLTTRAQAEQRLTEWIDAQKEQGYEVKATNFSFSCNN